MTGAANPAASCRPPPVWSTDWQLFDAVSPYSDLDHDLGGDGVADLKLAIGDLRPTAPFFPDLREQLRRATADRQRSAGPSGRRCGRRYPGLGSMWRRKRPYWQRQATAPVPSKDQGLKLRYDGACTSCALCRSGHVTERNLSHVCDRFARPGDIRYESVDDPDPAADRCHHPAVGDLYLQLGPLAPSRRAGCGSAHAYGATNIAAWW